MTTTPARKLFALAIGDARNAGRDTTLLPLLLAPLLLIVVVRYGVPPLAELLQMRLDFDLMAFSDLISYLASSITPFLFGIMFGFLLLEEREQGIIAVISITPLTKRGYIAYKLVAPTVLSLCASLLVGTTIRLGVPAWSTFLASRSLSALLAPLIALVLATYADNRVEGLALAKALGLLLLAPAIVYFAPAPWRYITLLVPTAWPAQIAFTAASPASMIGWSVAGAVVHGALLHLLARRFQRGVG